MQATTAKLTEQLEDCTNNLEGPLLVVALEPTDAIDTDAGTLDYAEACFEQELVAEQMVVGALSEYHYDVDNVAATYVPDTDHEHDTNE